MPSIEYLEQTAIRLATGQGKRKLEDLGGATIAFDPMEVIPLRNQSTDELTGETKLAHEIMSDIYSAIRKWQEDRNV